MKCLLSVLAFPHCKSLSHSSLCSCIVLHSVFTSRFYSSHLDLHRWMDCFFSNSLPFYLQEFPAAHHPFLQVIAQGILIKAKICCWEATFQTSCEFNVKKSDVTPSSVINTLLWMKCTLKRRLSVRISVFIYLAFCQPQYVYLIPSVLHTYTHKAAFTPNIT